MTTIETIIIKVTYEVGIANVTMPNEVLKQLTDAYENNIEIDVSDARYTEAHEWIVFNISESDAFQYKSEVKEITE
jgi:hypothetical protein